MERILIGILPGENVLLDDYPVYAGYLWYPDSLVGMSIVNYSPVTDFVVGKGG